MTTQAHEVAAARSQPKRRIVGTFNPGLLVLAAGCVVGAFVLAWGFLAPPPNDASNLLNVLPALCLLVTVESLLATCRIIVDPAGFIDVIGPVASRRVPVAELVAIKHFDGLRLRLVSGRRIGSIAYGSSLLGRALRYPRSAKAARRIESAIGGLPVREEPQSTQSDSVTWRPRTRGLLAVFGLNCVLVLGTVVLNVALARGA